MKEVNVDNRFRRQLAKMHAFICGFSDSYEGDKNEIGLHLLICFFMEKPDDVTPKDIALLIKSANYFVEELKKEMEEENG